MCNDVICLHQMSEVLQSSTRVESVGLRACFRAEICCFAAKSICVIDSARDSAGVLSTAGINQFNSSRYVSENGSENNVQAVLVTCRVGTGLVDRKNFAYSSIILNVTPRLIYRVFSVTHARAGIVGDSPRVVQYWVVWRRVTSEGLTRLCCFSSVTTVSTTYSLVVLEIAISHSILKTSQRSVCVAQCLRTWESAPNSHRVDLNCESCRTLYIRYTLPSLHGFSRFS